MIRVYIVNAGRKESFILTTQASLDAQTSTGGEHYSALLWVLTLYSELLTDPFSKYCLSKGVKLLCLRLSDVREAGRTLPVALMGEKRGEKRDRSDLFHRICHASTVENTSLFPHANWLQQHLAWRP